MILLPVFLVHLFCSIFPCEVKSPYPSDPENLMKRHSFRAFDSNRTSIVQLSEKGGVEGYLMKSILQRDFHAFEGIPYGESTGGEARFKVPVKKASWEGTREAKAPGPACAQVQRGRITPVHGSEDCLYLNVYTPMLPTEPGFRGELPTIINIHGGSFAIQSGSQTTGPAYLLDENVVLVSFNYRLGILGFLSTGDMASSGNWGLKDQALAIGWVHDNIEYFGGNKSLVTLMGQSAGGVSVHLHMIYSKPEERKYFSAGISGSGSTFNTWALLKPNYVARINRRLGVWTGCSPDNSQDFVDCLRNVEVNNLVRVQSFLYDIPSMQFPNVLFGPVVEPLTNPDGFITESHEDVYKRNGTARYPWILSQVADEGHIISILLEVTRTLSPFIQMNWRRFLPTLFDLNDSGLEVTELDEIAARIQEFYFQNEPITAANMHQIGNALSDRHFNFPSFRALQAHSKIAPTYACIFEYLGRTALSNMSLIRGLRLPYVIHGDDEAYYFNVSMPRRVPGFKTTEKEYKIVKFLSGWVSNFAKERNPTPQHSEFNQINWNGTWKPWMDGSNERNYLHINDTISLLPEVDISERIAFWRDLMQRYSL